MQGLKEKLERWEDFVVEWTEEERVRMKTVFKDLNGALHPVVMQHIHTQPCECGLTPFTIYSK